MLVEEEGCSGLARMVWPAGCAWGHSVGSTILTFRVPPSIVYHVEGNGGGGSSTKHSAAHPHPKADLDPREVPMVSVIN